MGADPKAVGVAAIVTALAGGGYVVYKLVNGERITPSPEDFKNIANIFSSNEVSEGDDGSSHENHDCDHNEFDQDGRVVFS